MNCSFGSVTCRFSCSEPVVRRPSFTQSRRANPSTRRRRRRVRPSREGATAARPDLRVKPVAPPERWPRASSRPRWPDDAKTTFKNAKVFSPHAETLPRQGGQGLVSQAVAPRPWASAAWLQEAQDAAKPYLPRSEVNRTPKESRPFRPRFRWPHARETSPCPPCRRQGSGRREAQPHQTRGRAQGARQSAFIAAPPSPPPAAHCPTRRG